MDNLKVVKNTLPPNIKSWIDFHQKVKQDVDLSTAKEIRYVDFNFADFPEVQEPKIYQVDVDYLKARCWEEHLKTLPSKTETLRIIEGLYNNSFGEARQYFYQILKFHEK